VSSRGGDYFGPPVNLAARMVAVAEAGQLLVDPPVATALAATGTSVEPLGRRDLRGIEGPVELFTLADPVGRPGGSPR
jgi:adenylate cyclase